MGTDVFTALVIFQKVGAHKYGKAKASMHTHALSQSHTHTLIQTSGLTKAFVSFTSCWDSLCHPDQSFVSGGQCVPHTNQLAEMLNLAEFKTDADRHIRDFKRYICNQENSGVAKIYQSNLTISLSIYYKP